VTQEVQSSKLDSTLAEAGNFWSETLARAMLALLKFGFWSFF